MWYPTYEVAFRGLYSYTHEIPQDGFLEVTYRFPATQAYYDNFRFEVDGHFDPQSMPAKDRQSNLLTERVPVSQNQQIPFTITYKSRGLDIWHYSFGANVNRVSNFTLAMTTNFSDINFPVGTLSPNTKTKNGPGWLLNWNFSNLISGCSIGMEMPRKLNPGPLASQVCFFAPISLGIFFIWMFVITLLRKVELHPMNYLFLAAAFFAFHLLFAYSVDHIELITAFGISSAVSMFLVVSYLRLVTGLRFAALEAGLSQIVYLIFFSYAHFIEGYTGLILTIGGILTLFVIMQLTGRIPWAEKFKPAPKRGPRFASPAPETPALR